MGIPYMPEEYGIYDTFHNRWIEQLESSTPIWATNDQFLTVRILENEPSLAKTLSLFRISPEGILQQWAVENVEFYYLDISPDERHVMLTSNSTGVLIVDLQTAELTRIISLPEGYSIHHIFWTDSDMVNFQVGTATNPYSSYAIYTIRIPQLESQTGRQIRKCVLKLTCEI